MSASRYISTYSGIRFYPLDPVSSDVVLEDVAHALSNICRYTGHSKTFYSVAEHSYHMAKHFMEQGDLVLAKEALLHDATEAYLSDVSRPVKYSIEALLAAEQKLRVAIAKRFHLSEEVPPEVKDIDKRILCDEIPALIPSCLGNGACQPWNPIGVRIGGWYPLHAERMFLDLASEIGVT